MRITSSMYYKNIYGDNNSKLSQNLFDVNKQIASGLKIQYVQDDVIAFSETMRLDNEITTLNQITKSVESGYKVSTQSDFILNEFQTTLDRTKTLLLQASNGSQSDSSLDAIAAELRGIEEHFKNLSNSSIGGKYLFSGSAVDTKPIRSDGTYMGNDISMSSFAGSGIQQQYNLTGADLFLGEETLVKRQVTTNTLQYNLSAKYPDFSDTSISGEEKMISVNDTIRDLMGDTDDDPANSNGSHFYVSGTKSDGTAFTSHIKMSASDSVDSLLTHIGTAFGNTPNTNVVNVSLNDYGQIIVEDKMKGSSKLEFHMVGATDYDKTDGNDAADINDSIYNNIVDRRGLIDNLNDGETNFDAIMNETSTAANSNLYVKNFVQSPYIPVTTPTSELKSASYAMDLPAAFGDTLSITVDNGDSLPATTVYNQAFNIDSTTTYDDLKNQIELDGDFTVDIDGDTITLNTTAQGVAKGVSINTPLSTTNAAVTVTPTIVNSIATAGIDGLQYDRTEFSKNGSLLSSSTPQVLKQHNESTNPKTLLEKNAFATPSTKISDVADLSKGTAGTLDGTKFTLSGTDVSGNAYSAQIDFKNTAGGGSTFSLDTDGDGVYDNGTYDIFNTQSPRTAVDADSMTYQQLLDATNMIVTGSIPDPAGTHLHPDLTPYTAVEEYDYAIASSNNSGKTFLSYDGKINFQDLTFSETKASIALYDSNSGNFSAGTDASVMTFNSNNALTVRDPKTDFFKELDAIITSVENHKVSPDSSSGDMRNVGIENSIAMLDDLTNHIGREHAFVGAQSNALNDSLERTELLKISAATLRSSVIDTDLAEASLTLAQLNTNYQAMLSTVGKISQLSLVNYL